MSYSAVKKIANLLLLQCEIRVQLIEQLLYFSFSPSGFMLPQTGEVQGGRGSVQRDPDSCS